MRHQYSTPLTTLLIALPDATLRQSILNDIQGDLWTELLLPGKPSASTIEPVYPRHDAGGVSQRV